MILDLDSDCSIAGDYRLKAGEPQNSGKKNLVFHLHI